MLAIEMANVEENTLYEITMEGSHFGPITTRGTFSCIDIESNRVSIVPEWNTNLTLNYDADRIIKVEGAEGAETLPTGG